MAEEDVRKSDSKCGLGLQVLSITETQYRQASIVIISPDSDNLSVLQVTTIFSFHVMVLAGPTGQKTKIIMIIITRFHSED
jgi:hypothetical protein